MSSGGAESFAAAFRHFGVDARVVPEGDERTYELAGRYTSGDECLPARVTAGNFLKVIESPGFDPSRAAFFMPTAAGPCRFGQYAPFVRSVLDRAGYEEAVVLSPTSSDGYRALGELAAPLMKLGWMALVGSDALRKLLHRYRPHEIPAGAADRAHGRALEIFCSTLADPDIRPARMPGRLAGALEEARDIFRKVPADFSKDKMLIGVVGEIYCRLSEFSNEDLIRRLESFGARAWLSDISEWVCYTDEEQVRKLRMRGRALSREMLAVRMKKFIQRRYERKLLRPLEEELSDMREPADIGEILKRSEKYLPASGALGEMVLSVGKAVYLYENGADGIIDISPFTCMNGIVSEAVYPRVSRDHGGIPIRSFYFDGTRSDLENELAIFMELVSNYHNRRSGKAGGRNVA